jgi:aquaglyceroporin related protein
MASKTVPPETVYFEDLKMKQDHIDSTPTSSGGQVEHGPAIDHVEHNPSLDAAVHPELWWSKQRANYQDAFSEFFGVFIMILFGDGVVAQVVLSGGEKGGYQSITWGE